MPVHKRFRDIGVGEYFFFPGSIVPHVKRTEGGASEAGSKLVHPVGENERVVAILRDRDQIKVGPYIIPCLSPDHEEEDGPELESTGGEKVEAACRG